MDEIIYLLSEVKKYIIRLQWFVTHSDHKLAMNTNTNIFFNSRSLKIRPDSFY